MKSADTNAPVKESKPTYVENQEGCAFASRCPYTKEQCFNKKPEFRQLKPGHKLRCFVK
jgi:oligopeptide transport system ATP-binding protein